MRRSLVISGTSNRAAALVGAVVVAAALVSASGCGVAANDVAATVGTATVSATTVNELSASPSFMGAMASQAVSNGREGVVDGNSARQVLAFLIQREVLSQEVGRWGAEVTAEDRSAAVEMIEQQAPRLKGSQRDLVASFLADRAALQARLGEVDATDAAVLRRLYDGLGGYWDRVCMDAVLVRSSSVAAAQRSLNRGTDLTDLPDRVRGVQLAASRETCLPTSALPVALRSRLGEARRGVLVGPIDGVFPGDDSVLWLKVSATRHVSFRDARDELGQLAAAIAQRGVEQLLTLRANELVSIDPRYGSSVSISQQGLTVVPPATPSGAGPSAAIGGAAGAPTP